MKRHFTAWLVGPVAACVAPAVAFGDQVYLREADAALALFPQRVSAARKTLELTDTELAALGATLGRRIEVRRYVYLEVAGDAGLLGRIFMLDVAGQSQLIGFAVGVTTDGLLHDLQVMVYREPQGEAIEAPRFRKQFVGKRLSDPVTLGKDIDAVSGATISSRAATVAARKGLALAEVLRRRTSANP